MRPRPLVARNGPLQRLALGLEAGTVPCQACRVAPASSMVGRNVTMDTRFGTPEPYVEEWFRLCHDCITKVVAP